MYNIDPYRISLEELKGIMKHEFGYNDVTKIFYNPIGKTLHAGIRFITNDTGILEMLAEVPKTGWIEIYANMILAQV